MTDVPQELRDNMDPDVKAEVQRAMERIASGDYDIVDDEPPLTISRGGMTEQTSPMQKIHCAGIQSIGTSGRRG